MPTFFCPFCWRKMTEPLLRCPHCGANISEAEKRTFEEKLLCALEHTLPETVETAVWILGELRSDKADLPLTALLNQTKSFHLKSMILDALSKIGSDKAISVIRETCEDESALVRKKAQRLMAHIQAL